MASIAICVGIDIAKADVVVAGRPDGLPYSTQFAGRRLSEPLLCRIAAAYEQPTAWEDRHPPAAA